MRTLGDIMILLSAGLIVVQLASKGLLTIPQSTGFLAALAALLGITCSFTRVQKTSGFAHNLFRAGLPLLSLFAFAMLATGGDMRAMEGLIGQILVLVLVLFGIYYMFGVAFRRRKDK